MLASRVTGAVVGSGLGDDVRGVRVRSAPELVPLVGAP